MIEDNKNNPLTDFSDQIRAVEALLFAASDPLDEKTLRVKKNKKRSKVNSSKVNGAF